MLQEKQGIALQPPKQI